MTQYQGCTQLGNTQMSMQTHICELRPSVTVFLYRQRRIKKKEKKPWVESCTITSFMIIILYVILEAKLILPKFLLNNSSKSHFGSSIK